MRLMRSIFRLGLGVIAIAAMGMGCSSKPKPYGSEVVSILPGAQPQVWAIAPAINLSGQREVDPLLQSDILYHKLQEVRGLTVIPVDRTIQVYAALRIEQVQSATQAAIVCEALGCDALVVPTVTAYDPYDPPKWGGSLQMFRSARMGGIPAVDVREMTRQAAPDPTLMPAGPTQNDFVQAIGMFDAANGTVREALSGYARGRHDPVSPMGDREYFVNMDRYVGFAYHTLIGDLLRAEARRLGAAARPPAVASAGTNSAGPVLLQELKRPEGANRAGSDPEKVTTR
ncbi:hypothetical protein [Humisphaera borealis]|uniref:Uncharacterized protein n=1 Tax=Humisphaera borealis TaxID=2807512 RepID=A0A7M2X173_9BACT|nr:hypothetical protein [Humisphaera borealis]QOV91486.1 hypothetical protein IPV69_09070 [Humisphaera borealis]